MPSVSKSIQLAARSEASICGRSPVAIAGSNPAADMGSCLLCVMRYQVEVSASATQGAASATS